jgi:hypothetical protein
MIGLSPERLESWQALCGWLEARSFGRVHELRDVPAELQFLLEPENKSEFLALGLVWKSKDFWQLRPDHAIKLAYFAGDPETVAGMNGVRDRFMTLADRWLAVVDNLNGLLTLERGAPSRWDTDWALIARGQREAMDRVNVFALRGYMSEMARAVRTLRREVRSGGQTKSECSGRQ